MILDNPEQYKFLMFQKSKTKNKKYDALLMHKKTKKIKLIPFGDDRYPQYEDQTGLGLYSHMNTFDKERRRLYKIRHENTRDKKYSSSWFADRFLW